MTNSVRLSYNSEDLWCLGSLTQHNIIADIYLNPPVYSEQNDLLTMSIGATVVLLLKVGDRYTYYLRRKRLSYRTQSEKICRRKGRA